MASWNRLPRIALLGVPRQLEEYRRCACPPGPERYDALIGVALEEEVTLGCSPNLADSKYLPVAKACKISSQPNATALILLSSVRVCP